MMPNIKVCALFIVAAVIGSSAWVALRRHFYETSVEEDAIVALARTRAKEGDEESMVFLGLRAQLSLHLMAQNSAVKYDESKATEIGNESLRFYLNAWGAFRIPLIC